MYRAHHVIYLFPGPLVGNASDGSSTMIIMKQAKCNQEIYLKIKGFVNSFSDASIPTQFRFYTQRRRSNIYILQIMAIWWQ